MKKKEETPKRKLTTAATWRQRYDIAVDNQQPMFDRFKKWYDLQYATVTDENIALWRSKVFIPVLASKAWNLIAKFINLRPGFEVSVRDDTSEELERVGMDGDILQQFADKMQLKLEYDYDNPCLDESIRSKVMQMLVDTVVTGTGIGKVPWTVNSRKRYKRIVGDDGTVDLSKEEVVETKYGMNDIIPVNIFNVFVAPTATNLYSAPWIIIKEYKSLSQLQKMNKGGTEVYKNLDQVKASNNLADPFAIYKKARNRLTGDQDPIASDQTLDLVAVYECYEGDMIYTYADGGEKDGWVELRAQPNPYWHNKYPLVRFVVKHRPYDFWGEGIYEITERLQSAINDTFNHFMDNWNLSVDGMFFIDENSNVNDFVVEPGGVITYRQTKPEPAKIPDPNPNSVQLVNQFLEKAIEDSTISSYATGSPNSATDNTQGTATGIMRLQQAAGDVISFMRANFQETVHEIGEQWLSNNRQFMDHPMMLKGKKGVVQVDPADFQWDMELRIDDASMEPVSKEDQRNAFLQYQQQMMAMQQASMAQHQAVGTKPLVLNFDELFEEMSEKFGIKTWQEMIMSEDDVQEAQAAQQQQMAQAAQQAGQEQSQAGSQQPKLPSETLTYKDAPEDIKRQIEQQAGLQPSEMTSPSGTDQHKTQQDIASKQLEDDAKLNEKVDQLHPQLQQDLMSMANAQE